MIRRDRRKTQNIIRKLELLYSRMKEEDGCMWDWEKI